MCAHVLVAEDDTMQAELVRRSLLAEGHTATVVGDGASALDAVRRLRPDLVVLDLMLPVLDGFEVCRVLSRDTAVPVVMLTARSTEDDVLLGLGMGADDYLTKPYSPRELMARIHAVLRRADRNDGEVLEDRVLEISGLSVDPRRHEVRCGGTPVQCTPAEFQILHALAVEPGRVFSRQQLLERTRGFDRASTERAVDTHIVNLRRKLEVDPQRPKRILTVFGIGYKMCGPAK